MLKEEILENKELNNQVRLSKSRAWKAYLKGDNVKEMTKEEKIQKFLDVKLISGMEMNRHKSDANLGEE